MLPLLDNSLIALKELMYLVFLLLIYLLWDKVMRKPNTKWLFLAWRLTAGPILMSSVRLLVFCYIKNFNI